jgi:hypothetical protein
MYTLTLLLLIVSLQTAGSLTIPIEARRGTAQIALQHLGGVALFEVPAPRSVNRLSADVQSRCLDLGLPSH